jgi:hypothetical protein
MEEAMGAIIELLEQIEKLIYRTIIWLVLIPKTLIQIVLFPSWAPKYIKQELNEGNARFDEYFSPIVLLLVVAIFPFIIWGFLPNPGIEIFSDSIDNPTANRTLDFSSEITFISTSTDGFVTVFWRVEQEAFVEGAYFYPSIQLTRHTNNPVEADTSEYDYFYQLDNYTVWDEFSYTFPVSGGSYWVVVEAYKSDAQGNLIEEYLNDVYVFVPPNSQENVEVSAFRTQAAEGETKAEGGIKIEEVAEKLKSEETILLALGLLIPPLLFALAAKLFAGESLSEDILKETFYVQCYYFSPIAALFWGMRYAIRFLTPDVFNYYMFGDLLIYAPLILAIFWFISVQTYAIAGERKIHGWQAFLIAVGCAVVILAGVIYIVNLNTPSVLEGTRVTAIWFYPLLTIVLLTAYHWLVARQRKKENRKASFSEFVPIGATAIVVVFISGFVLYIGRFSSPHKEFDQFQNELIAEARPTLTQIAFLQITPQQVEIEVAGPPELEPTSTPLLLATAVSEETVVGTSSPEQDVIEETPTPQKYYTEEFDGNLDAWPFFLTRGDESVVNFYLDSGKLFFQLLQQDEKKPWVYLVNNTFTYTDVEIEAFTENSGVNSNGISLVCRYNQAGWYEFMVSNGGEYIIYAHDAENKIYHELAKGGSPVINIGQSANTYTAICKESELTLLINGQVVTTTFDKRFNFAEGFIGLAVASPQGLPVSVDFDYVKVSEPQND